MERAAFQRLSELCFSWCCRRRDEFRFCVDAVVAAAWRLFAFLALFWLDGEIWRFGDLGKEGREEGRKGMDVMDGLVVLSFLKWH